MDLGTVTHVAQGETGGEVGRPVGARAASVVSRVASVDVLRGIVMVLMVIDHVRVYSGIPAGGPTAGVFLTRWVTHFCAPVFVFLAGTSAFLHGRRLGDTRALSRDLLTRGLLLVALEATLIRLSWTFSVASMTFQLAGVIWMLGCCMVLMSALVRLPLRAIAAFGVLVIALQDLLGPLAGGAPPFDSFLKFLYIGGEVTLGQSGIVVSVLYSIVPWIGVMAAGYAFGVILLRSPLERDRWMLRVGLSATALFLALAAAPVLLADDGDGGPALLQILNQRKYPASQVFLMMTLGPAIAFMPIAERVRSIAAKVLAAFGRVPMFFYLLHIPVIHLLALLTWRLRDGTMHHDWFLTAPYVSVPADQRWSLGLLYVIFAIVVAVLYVPCRWFAGVKARHKDSWLRFV